MVLKSPPQKKKGRIVTRMDAEKSFWTFVGKWLTPKDTVALLEGFQPRHKEHPVLKMAHALLFDPDFLVAGFQEDEKGTHLMELLRLNILPSQSVRSTLSELLKTIRAKYDPVYLEHAGHRIELDPVALGDMIHCKLLSDFGPVDFPTQLFADELTKTRKHIKSRGICLLEDKVKDKHARAVSALAYTVVDNRKLLVSSSWDGLIRVWDDDMTKSGACVETLSDHTGVVCALTVDPISPHLLWSSSYDFTVRQWDLRTGACVKIIPFYATVASLCFVFDDDEFVIVAGVINGELHTINAKGEKRALVSLFGNITNACNLDVPSTFAIALETGAVKVLNSKGVILLELLGHSSWAYVMTSHHVDSPEMNGRLITCSDDMTIRVWNLVDGSCEGVLHGHDFRVLSCTAFKSEETMDVHIVTCSYDGTVKLWNWTKRVHVASYTIGQCLRAILSDSDRQCAFVGTIDGRVVVLDFDVTAHFD